VKKVRYAIGALGMAPALALPAAHAGALAPHQSTSPGKRVRLAAEQNPAAAASTCHHSADHSATASGPNLLLFADWNGTSCVFQVLGKYKHALTGREMVISGTCVHGGHSEFIDSSGHLKAKSVSFLETLDRHFVRVCISILSESFGTRQAGPQCVNT
jgi:hypothetical protein